MSDFKEYPKKMRHPEHAAAVFQQLPCDCKDKNKCNCRTGLFAKDTIMKSPERYPEVTVFTLNQEKQYASRGYRPNNMANSDEYDQAILESSPVAGYRFIEFPKWKYHAFEIPVVVQSAQEEEALGEGWSDTPIQATADDLPQDEPDEQVIVQAAAPAAVKAAPAQRPKPATTTAAPAKAKGKSAAKHAHA